LILIAELARDELRFSQVGLWISTDTRFSGTSMRYSVKRSLNVEGLGHQTYDSMEPEASKPSLPQIPTTMYHCYGVATDFAAMRNC